MKFLIDQDVYAITVRFIKELGHDVIQVAELGLSQEDDTVLLQKAQKDNRIFITRDRDFGGLIFLQALGAVHNELKRILGSYSEEDLKKAFVVVEPGRYRFRAIKKFHEK